MAAGRSSTTVARTTDLPLTAGSEPTGRSPSRRCSVRSEPNSTHPWSPRPLILQYLSRRPPRVHHRFDGQNHSFLQPRILVLAVHVVRDLRLFMELGADAMAHILPHYRKPIRLDVALHRAADVKQPVAGPHLVDGELERFLRHTQQLFGLLAHFADRHGNGGIAIVAVQLHPGVDGNDVA